MNKSRLTETRIIGVLKEMEAGRLIKEVARSMVPQPHDSLGDLTPCKYLAKAAAENSNFDCL